MGALAFGVTMTFSFPFAALLVYLRCSLQTLVVVGQPVRPGQRAGAAVLVGLFHHLGWEVIAQRYPELIQSDALQWAGNWLRQYGALALLVIAGIARAAHACAPGLCHGRSATDRGGGQRRIGPGLKYTALAWLTARFPGRFVRYPLSTDEPPPTPAQGLTGRIADNPGFAVRR